MIHVGSGGARRVIELRPRAAGTKRSRRGAPLGNGLASASRSVESPDSQPLPSRPAQVTSLMKCALYMGDHAEVWTRIFHRLLLLFIALFRLCLRVFVCAVVGGGVSDTHLWICFIAAVLHTMG